MPVKYIWRCRPIFKVILKEVASMKIIVLDSSPTAPMRIPSEIHFNTTPALKKKPRSSSILGFNSPRYSHFVPLGESNNRIKQLLNIEETETGPTEASGGYGEILKAEKAEKQMFKAIQNYFSKADEEVIVLFKTDQK